MSKYSDVQRVKLDTSRHKGREYGIHFDIMSH